MKDIFRFFIRKNWKHNDLSNDELDDLGEEFEKYLNEKLSKDAWDKIVPKDPQEVIRDMDHPLKENGFHPAFMLHFMDFLKIMKDNNL